MSGRAATLLALTALAAAAPPAAAQPCAATPAYDPAIPTWETVNGFALGARAATNEEINAYLDAVDGASARVTAGTLARSWQGRPLRYVLVSRPGALEPARLGRTAAAWRAVRRARVDRRRAARLAAREPAFAWITANVHGNEPSGADASMRLLYDLAARTDCANLRRLERLVTVILPVQNPDGRAAGTRVNAYGFDMNRDWFARTQPETDGKLALLSQLPPILYVDAHEQAGTAYFFPPNADPIHHEISAEALGAINGVYGPAMRRAFDERGIDYANYTTYDLFFMGYGDTVPTTAFGAAGMTFEKGGQSPYDEKTAEQFITQDVSLTAAAEQKERLLVAWARQWRAARRQGARGALEPNLVVQPGNTVQFAVPRTPVFAYAIDADANAADAARLVNRLRALDVEVYRLRSALRVRGYHRYGVPGTRPRRLPRGTFWIPMAQAQKHWIEALLGEDAYVPFPYFYDVSAWSNPLLMGISGGVVTTPERPRSPRPVGRAAVGSAPRAAAPAYAFTTDSSGALGLVLDLLGQGIDVRRAPVAFSDGGARWPAGTAVAPGGTDLALLGRFARARQTPVRPLSVAPGGLRALRRPHVALLGDLVSIAGSSAGFARFVLERRLALEPDVLSSPQIEAGALVAGGYDALIVPGGLLPTGGLTPAALGQIQLFVRSGGTYVGYGTQGITVARAAGLSTVVETPAPAGYQVPGASFRVLLDPADPLAWGFGAEGFAFNAGDPILRSGSSGGRLVAAYPADARFFISGYAEGTEALRGTPAALDEAVGSGRALLLTFDPAFRGYVESGERLLANALLYPRVAASRRARAAPPPPVRPELLAGAHAGGRDARVRVAADDEDALRGAAAAAGVPRSGSIERDLGSATLRVPNPRGLTAEDLPWAPRLLAALARARVRPTLIVF